MGSALKRVAGFFAVFLGLLATLATVRYPVLPESLAAIYRVDREDAISLSTALTLIGFAACLYLAAAQFAVSRNGHRSRHSGHGLMWVGALLLAACVLALGGNAVSVRASTRMANAISAARERDSFDLSARDLLATMDDDSNGIWQKYRAAIQFLDMVRPEEMGPSGILNVIERAPLQDAIFLSYVLAVFCLKVGIFATSSAIYLLGRRQRPKWVRGMEVDRSLDAPASAGRSIERGCVR